MGSMGPHKKTNPSAHPTHAVAAAPMVSSTAPLRSRDDMRVLRFVTRKNKSSGVVVAATVAGMVHDLVDLTSLPLVLRSDPLSNSDALPTRHPPLNGTPVLSPESTPGTTVRAHPTAPVSLHPNDKVDPILHKASVSVLSPRVTRKTTIRPTIKTSPTNALESTSETSESVSATSPPTLPVKTLLDAVDKGEPKKSALHGTLVVTSVVATGALCSATMSRGKRDCSLLESGPLPIDLVPVPPVTAHTCY